MVFKKKIVVHADLKKVGLSIFVQGKDKNGEGTNLVFSFDMGEKVFPPKRFGPAEGGNFF